MALTVAWPVRSQSDAQVPRRVIKQFEKARQMYMGLEWAEAKKDLLAILDKNPDYIDAWLLLSELAFETGNQELAYQALSAVSGIDSVNYPMIYPEMAKIDYENGNYEEALRKLRYSRVKYRDPGYKIEERVEFALEQIRRNGDKRKPVALGINTVENEYFPSMTIDGERLVFTRQDRKHGPDGTLGQEDLYESFYVDGDFTDARVFPEPITTPRNEGTQSVRQDGRLMFFTACKRPDSKGGCDIYYSRKQGETWDIPQNLGYPVNTRYWESTPFLSLDGKTLYFSSTRPGGYGGMDIWISEWNPEGGWSAPVNAGPKINTAEDEMAPYVHGDGKCLYFSSSGWIGMGGFDLFVSSCSEKSDWTEPVNLGYPVNTNGEEMGISFHSKRNFALFSSNRDSTMGRDILRFYLPDSLSPPRLAIVSGRVINGMNRRPISATVLVQDQEGQPVSRVESDPSSGNYLIGLPVDNDHRFVVNRSGFLFYSAYLPSDSLEPGKTFEWNILLEPLRMGSRVVLRNVFFDIDSYKIKKESFPELLELVELLKNNKETNIEVSGHTDNTGDYGYNIKLSQDRAESVRKFLVEKGIDPARLEAKGYGPDQPIADNATEKGRAENRRTEIKITGTRNP